MSSNDIMRFFDNSSDKSQLNFTSSLIVHHIRLLQQQRDAIDQMIINNKQFLQKIRHISHAQPQRHSSGITTNTHDPLTSISRFYGIPTSSTPSIPLWKRVFFWRKHKI